MKKVAAVVVIPDQLAIVPRFGGTGSHQPAEPKKDHLLDHRYWGRRRRCGVDDPAIVQAVPFSPKYSADHMILETGGGDDHGQILGPRQRKLVEPRVGPGHRIQARQSLELMAV